VTGIDLDTQRESYCLIHNCNRVIVMGEWNEMLSSAPASSLINDLAGLWRHFNTATDSSLLLYTGLKWFMRTSLARRRHSKQFRPTHSDTLYNHAQSPAVRSQVSSETWIHRTVCLVRFWSMGERDRMEGPKKTSPVSHHNTHVTRGSHCVQSDNIEVNGSQTFSPLSVA